MTAAEHPGTGPCVLVLNSGSSSLKYQVIDVAAREALLTGAVERIGAGGAVLTQVRARDGARFRSSRTILDHRDAVDVVLELVADAGTGVLDRPGALVAVGHRVVHGGERFTRAVRVDEEVLEGIRDAIALAPLHNPHNLSGILAARDRLPDVPHVAVFDTAFHATLPPVAFHYALPYALYRRHRIRRYGFHGTSHAHVAERMARWLSGEAGAEDRELRIVSLHLGNGASACAIRGGRSVDTSMGFTPLEGLVMGSRSGDVDPAVVLHVMAREELTGSDATSLLNKHSGLLGLSGISSDMRDLLEEEAAGDERARLALDVYAYRVRKYVGAYAAAMGGLDAIAFTGGVGQNSPAVRARCLHEMGFLGVRPDAGANETLVDGREGLFHVSGAPVALAVVRTGEELVIALQAAALAGAEERSPSN